MLLFYLEAKDNANAFITYHYLRSARRREKEVKLITMPDVKLK